LLTPSIHTAPRCSDAPQQDFTHMGKHNGPLLAGNGGRCGRWGDTRRCTVGGDAQVPPRATRPASQPPPPGALCLAMCGKAAGMASWTIGGACGDACTARAPGAGPRHTHGAHTAVRPWPTAMQQAFTYQMRHSAPVLAGIGSRRGVGQHTRACVGGGGDQVPLRPPR
jgi:hypothetical protein